MFVVGLTGSLAMGKSTTAKIFADLGCPVFDSDAAVHTMYARDGEAVPIVAQLFPDAVVNQQVDRKQLADHVLGNPAALKKLEKAVHPLVKKRQQAFINDAKSTGHNFVILDIPLLFETGQDQNVDAIVVASAPADIQQSRALERPGMTLKKFNEILAVQLPDSEKRVRADYVVDTGRGLDAAFDQVKRIVAELQSNSLPESC